MKKRIIDSVLIALMTAMFFTVVLPVQSYLANADSFSFDFGDVACGCGLRMLCLS